MSEEEIENRILICEIKERDYLEVGNTKTANRYSNEKYKWEKLLDRLDKKRDEELSDYKKGYYRLEQIIDNAIKYIEKEKNIIPSELFGLVDSDKVLSILKGDERNDN